MLYIIANGEYELTKRLLSELDSDRIRVIWTEEFQQYKNKFFSHLTKLLFLFNLPFKYNFSKDLRNQLSQITDNDTVLAWDIVSIPLLLSLRSLCKTSKLNLWLWNTFSRSKIKIYFLKKIKKWFNVYTFDENDAKEFNIKLKNQVCYDIEKYSKNDVQILNSIYFVGVDKGRYKGLKELYDKLTEKGFKCDFNLVKDNTSVNDDSFYSRGLSFIENINHIYLSRVVLDFTKDNQTGLTMRALEAMFSKKKLITNNRNIRKVKFYNRENIFVLGEDSFEHIEDFIDSPFKNINFDFSEFRISSWIKEFL